MSREKYSVKSPFYHNKLWACEVPPLRSLSFASFPSLILNNSVIATHWTKFTPEEHCSRLARVKGDDMPELPLLSGSEGVQGDGALLFAGLWRRRVLYEPRDVVQDATTGEEPRSLVLWAQAPSGVFIDIREAGCEDFIPRGFSGCLSARAAGGSTASRVENGQEQQQQQEEEGRSALWHLVWDRFVDSKPSSCPTGVDSAVGRWITDSVLMEEGDGYLEVWERVATWGSNASATLRFLSTNTSTPDEVVDLSSRSFPSPEALMGRWRQPDQSWELQLTWRSEASPEPRYTLTASALVDEAGAQTVRLQLEPFDGESGIFIEWKRSP